MVYWLCMYSAQKNLSALKQAKKIFPIHVGQIFFAVLWVVMSTLNVHKLEKSRNKKRAKRSIQACGSFLLLLLFNLWRKNVDITTIGYRLKRTDSPSLTFKHGMICSESVYLRFSFDSCSSCLLCHVCIMLFGNKVIATCDSQSHNSIRSCFCPLYMSWKGLNYRPTWNVLPRGDEPCWSLRSFESVIITMKGGWYVCSIRPPVCSPEYTLMCVLVWHMEFSPRSL